MKRHGPITLGLFYLFLIGADLESLCVAGEAPTVTTGTPSGFTSTSATIYGVVNPNGLPTTFYWEWGTTTTYGKIIWIGSAGGQTTSFSIDSGLTGLSPDTTYHYQLVATNSAGVAFGGDQSFTTPTVAEEAFSYVINNNTVTITGYSGTDSTVEIPGIIARLPVVSIGNSAFSGMTNLSNVTIPASVTSIGGYAFGSCSGLASITIPNSVTNILGNAFMFCSGLTNITIPESVTSMGGWVFANCINLRSATINSPSIGDYEFFECGSLARVDLGNSVITIGPQAFEYCGSLTNLTIPDNVRTIMDGNNSWWVEGAFSSCTNLESVTIGAGVTNVGDNAFAGCPSLRTLTIPDGVDRIGYHAFLSCGGLTNILIGNGVTKIEVDADTLAPYAGTPFFGCTNLTTFIVGALNPAYSSLDGVLFDKTQGKLIACPEGRTGSYLVPNGVTNIAEMSVYFCQGLTNVTMPGSVVSIGYRGFAYCTGLTDIVIGNNVKDIGDSAFYGCTGLSSAVVPNSVTNIAEYGFGGCTNLMNLTLGTSVINIGEGAFSGCSGLARVTIPNSVTGIADSAFYGCSSLTNVTIPNGVTLIGAQVFGNCGGLSNITIGAGVASIGSRAFFGCSNMTAITVDAGNPIYSSAGGVLFDKNQATLVLYPQGIMGNYTVPESVTSIGSEAFAGCARLTAVTIGDTVTNIGDNAFQGCTSLSSITIPKGVTAIGNHVFDGCSGLSGIEIPDNVRSIGDWAFAFCGSLSSIKISDSVTNIGYVAFFDCGSVTNLIMGNGVTSIGQQFQDCTGLVNITIPRSVTDISQYAFAGCSGLQGIYFEGNAPNWGDCECIGLYGTVYYLPGTTGWGATLGGHPTALWNPTPQTSDPSFGVRLKSFGFNIAGTADIPLVIEGSIDVSARSWVAVQSCTLTNGLIYFSDGQWTNFPNRLYRIRSP